MTFKGTFAFQMRFETGKVRLLDQDRARKEKKKAQLKDPEESINHALKEKEAVSKIPIKPR